MTKRESFRDRTERNTQFSELKAQGTPGLIRWSDVEFHAAQGPGVEAEHSDVWYLAYETAYPTLAHVEPFAVENPPND